jgi:hypothetical protein
MTCATARPKDTMRAKRVTVGGKGLDRMVKARQAFNVENSDDDSNPSRDCG